MSGGGLLQLVAFGAQDMYLTSSPQITLWQVVYRRHTNFAMESMEQTFNGTVDFGRKATCLVARNGDLIWHAYLKIDLPALNAGSGTVRWVNEIGHFIIDEISTEIGGAIIDKQYGQWLSIYNELTQSAEKEAGYRVMIGDIVALTDPAATIAASSIYVPLQFWWNRNPGLALPLIALMYHDVKINVTFKSWQNLIIQVGGTPITSLQLGDVKLYIDYIFLDAAERKMFSQQSHEYLFEQVQFLGAESWTSQNIRQKLQFSHPCKELIWAIQPDSNATANAWNDFTNGGADTISSGYDNKIQLNTHDRISARGAAYFGLMQPYYHHTRIPRTGIYVYSFSVRPEEHQPSGSINMSRIEGSTLVLQSTTGTNPIKLYTYAVNYNVLRITSGMGGTAFAS